MHQFTIPVTREQLEASRAKIASNHQVHLIGDEGTAEAHGVKLSFRYDLEIYALVVNVDSKPFYVTEGAIESAVRDWFKT